MSDSRCISGVRQTQFPLTGTLENMTSTFSWADVLERLLAGGNLSVAEATSAMDQIIGGHATDAQLSAFLIALRAKGETVDEVIGFRNAVLAHAVPLQVSSRALDIVGTGGDKHRTVNVSTAASIVCASLGVPVLKHGNRAASSASGSSDVLAELGVSLDAAPERVASTFEQLGIGFAFAAAFHPGFKHAAAVRSQLGVPTIFNILGPLCNPARPEASAVGVASAARIPLIVGVFQSRDANALVFRGDNGLDELSTCGHSRIWEVSRGSVVEHDFDPAEIGIPTASMDDIRGGSPAENADTIRRLFAGETGPVRDIVALNAAAGLVAFDLIDNAAATDIALRTRLKDAFDLACDAIENGAAAAKLDAWAAATQA